MSDLERIPAMFCSPWDAIRRLKESDGYFNHQCALGKSKFFNGRNQFFLQALVETLTVELFVEGQDIIREGNEGDRAYFLNRGSVDVLINRGAVKVATLDEGSVFGEMAIFGSGRRCATIRATEFCDCRVIHFSQFQKLLRQFPAENKYFLDLYEQRLKETNAKKKELPKRRFSQLVGAVAASARMQRRSSDARPDLPLVSGRRRSAPLVQLPQTIPLQPLEEEEEDEKESTTAQRAVTDTIQGIKPMASVPTSAKEADEDGEEEAVTLVRNPRRQRSHSASILDILRLPPSLCCETPSSMKRPEEEKKDERIKDDKEHEPSLSSSRSSSTCSNSRSTPLSPAVKCLPPLKRIPAVPPEESSAINDSRSTYPATSAVSGQPIPAAMGDSRRSLSTARNCSRSTSPATTAVSAQLPSAAMRSSTEPTDMSGEQAAADHLEQDVQLQQIEQIRRELQELQQEKQPETSISFSNGNENMWSRQQSEGSTRESAGDILTRADCLNEDVTKPNDQACTDTEKPSMSLPSIPLPWKRSSTDESQMSSQSNSHRLEYRNGKFLVAATGADMLAGKVPVPPSTPPSSDQGVWWGRRRSKHSK